MRYALCLVFLCAIAQPAASHTLGQSYIFLRVYDDSVEVRLEITAEDLQRVLGLDWNPNNRISLEEIGANLSPILAYVRPRLSIGNAGQELNLRFVDYEHRRLKEADYVLLNFVIDDHVGDRLEVAYPVLFEVDDKRRNMLVIEHNWRTSTFNNEGSVSLIFSADNPRQTLYLEKASVLRGLLGFIRLGAWHIWIGLDHILFLIALALPSVLYREQQHWKPVDRFRRAMLNILAIVTFFTIAHSITLSLAAMEIVNMPSRVVESIIAASIVVAALHNVFPRFHGREWALAFVFGLFHGFGFATVLADLGLERKYLVLSLLGFNAGVEAGQIAIIGVAFPVLFLMRKRSWYPRTVLAIGSLVLAAVALFWLAERALDIPLYQYALRVPGYLQRHLLGGI